MVRGARHPGDRRPRRVRLPALPRRRHGHQPAVAAAAGPLAAGVLVVAAPAGARRDPGRQHLLRHAAGARRPGAVRERCSGTCSRHPRGRRCSSRTWRSRPPPTSRRWASSAASCCEKAGDHRHTLDIKRGGIGAVVELARVHALSVGSPAVNTQARIEAARGAGILGDARADDLRDAFEFISYVRLRHQAAQVRARRADPTTSSLPTTCPASTSDTCARRSRSCGRRSRRWRTATRCRTSREPS